MHHSSCTRFDAVSHRISSKAHPIISLGWRMDMGSACHVVAPLTTLIQHPIDPSMSYRGFLSLKHSYDWGSVGEYLVGVHVVIHVYLPMSVFSPA